VFVSSSSVAAEPPHKSGAEGREFSLREKLLLWLISWVAYLAIVVIGSTLRYSMSWEDESSPSQAIFNEPMIYSFWHRAVFPASWMWRKRRIVVMVSRSFDGEYIARIIKRLGFGAVRGSSSRGGTGALLGMKSEIERGAAVAFTIDGPRGPKYIAKPGPVALAKATGLPMVAFYVALSNAWVLKTWDEMMIPKPFSRALVRVSRRIPVPANADDDQMQDYHAQLQTSLDRITSFAEENVGRVGSKEFPVWRS
jgi:lysophospholipid acyltransferase (LPLAT)-like uncharacterized protein